MIKDNELLGSLSETGASRQTRITIETHTTTVIRTSGDALETAYCETCGSHSADLSMANALAILQVDQSELDLFRRTGDLHTTLQGGICGRSLIEHSRREIGTSKVINDRAVGT